MIGWIWALFREMVTNFRNFYYFSEKSPSPTKILDTIFLNAIIKMTWLKIKLDTWVSKVIDVSSLIFLRDETVSSSLLSAITRD